MLQLLKIRLEEALNNVTSAEEIVLIKLELICDALNRIRVLKFGIDLTTTVVPDRLKAAGFN